MSRVMFALYAGAIAGQGYLLCSFGGLWKLIPAYLLGYWSYRLWVEHKRTVEAVSNPLARILRPTR